MHFAALSATLATVLLGLAACVGHARRPDRDGAEAAPQRPAPAARVDPAPPVEAAPATAPGTVVPEAGPAERLAGDDGAPAAEEPAPRASGRAIEGHAIEGHATEGHGTEGHGMGARAAREAVESRIDPGERGGEPTSDAERRAEVAAQVILPPASAPSEQAVEPPGNGPGAAQEAPAEPPPRLPRALEAGEPFLGALVLDSTGRPAAVVEDLLLDPASGGVVAVVVARRPDGEEETRRHALPYAALRWEVETTEKGRAIVARLERSPEARSPELDPRELFADEARERIAGNVEEVEARDVPWSDAVVVKLVDAENLVHRVLVEPAGIASAVLDDLHPGSAVEFEGVFTRDAVAKLMVASAVSRAGARVLLRDEAGAAPWEAWRAALASARDLPAEIRTSDGTALPVVGWRLRTEDGVVSELLVGVDDTPRVLPWAAAQRRAGEPWLVAGDAAWARDLPPVE